MSALVLSRFKEMRGKYLLSEYKGAGLLVGTLTTRNSVYQGIPSFRLKKKIF